MSKEITLNEFIMRLQDICDEVGNHRLKSIGATSDGHFSIHLESEGGEKYCKYVSCFEN